MMMMECRNPGMKAFIYLPSSHPSREENPKAVYVRRKLP